MPCACSSAYCQQTALSACGSVKLKNSRKKEGMGFQNRTLAFIWTEDDVTCLVINKLESLTYY